MTAYYNEIDPFAAAWLRQLIAAGHIAPGDVDERDIRDVRPDDLAGYDQCHFFAGIGVWSLALRRAGWPDSRPVWTGSCPCQPFSAAGKGQRFADERHLWPSWHWLIDVCRPDVILGEQVASKNGLAWLDLVSADLEGTDYAVGAVDTCAAGFGAPHIRQRLYWMAYAERTGLEGHPRHGDHRREPGRVGAEPRGSVAAQGTAGGLADAVHAKRWPLRLNREHGRHGQDAGRQEAHDLVGARSEVRGLGHSERLGAGRDARASVGSERRPAMRPERHDAGPSGASGRLADAASVRRKMAVFDQRQRRPQDGERQTNVAGGNGAPNRPGPTNGLWRDADWLHCRDGKWRPVEPGTFPLAHGVAGRVGQLRAYGNAIVAPQAQAFVEAVIGLRLGKFA